MPVEHALEAEAGPVGEPAPDVGWTRGLRGRHAVSAWAAVATVLLAVQWIAVDGGRHTAVDGHLFDGWNKFDGPEYLRIASDGYRARALVWFPLYPLLIRAVDAVLGDAILSAVIISLAAGAAAIMLLWRWLEMTTMSVRSRATAVAVVCLYPYSWYLYGVVYSDALFLALCLGTFVCFERGHPAWAASVAALATATRPAGFALVIGLAVLTLERDGVISVSERAQGWVADLRLPLVVRPRRVRATTALPLLGLGGLIAYGAYQWRTWGSPLRWVTEQNNYHEPGTASLLKEQYFAAFTQGYDVRHLATTTLQAVLLAVTIALVPAVGRRFGWGYGAFVFCVALLPAVSVSTFMGVGRYLIPAFPAFALVGERLAHHRLARWTGLTVSASLLVLMSAGFARSWYLS